MEKTLILKKTDRPTEEQLKMVLEAKKRKYEYDEDCPPHSYEELSSMLEYTKKKVTMT